MPSHESQITSTTSSSHADGSEVPKSSGKSDSDRHGPARASGPRAGRGGGGGRDGAPASTGNLTCQNAGLPGCDQASDRDSWPPPSDSEPGSLSRR